MRRILLVTIIILTFGFFIPKTVSAAPDCNKNSVYSPGPPVIPPGPPFASTCPTLGLNEDMVIWAYAFDEDGNWLGGAPVSFAWTIPDSNLGTFTTVGSPTCTGISGVPPTQCQETNSLGWSSVNLHSSSNILTNAAVNVTATYAGNPLSKSFTINSACTTEPVLYYGIAGVRKTGTGNFQYSTAEVLSTCRSEYKLYEGDGRK